MENDNNNLNNSNQDDELKNNANEFFNKHQDEAEKILNDPDKLEKFLEDIEKKLKKLPNIKDWLSKNPKILESIAKIPLIGEVLSKVLQTLNIGEVLAKIPLMILLIKSYTKKEYTEIPYKSIIVIIIALIYFLSPIDLIPDWIPYAGYLDDAAMIGLALKIVGEDLEKYRAWREKRKTC